MRDYKKIYTNSLVRLLEKSGKEIRILEIPNEKIDLICQIFGIEKSDKFTVLTENVVVTAKKRDYMFYTVIVKLI